MDAPGPVLTAMTRERPKRPDRLRDGSSGIAPRALMNEGTASGRSEPTEVVPLSFTVRCDGPAPTRTHPAVSGLFSVIAVNTPAAAR